VILRDDYMPYEFSMFLFRDDSISDRRVFESFERQIAKSIVVQ
jgi:hypothetical protein